MPQYITVTSQGQISIPAKMRRKFALDKVRKATIEVEADKIVIKPIKDILEFKGIFKTHKKVPYTKTRQAFEEALSRSEA